MRDPGLSDVELDKAMRQIIAEMEPGIEFTFEDFVPTITELNDMKIHAGLWSLWEEDCLKIAMKDGKLAWGLTDKGRRLGS